MVKSELLEGMGIGTNCLECISDNVCQESYKDLYFDSVILLLEMFHKK